MPEVLITGAGSRLQGVGRLEDGRAVFVPGALPGERVGITVTRQAERFAEGKLTSVLAPSAARRESQCPAYPRCGGCQARHMTYECSLSLKRERVRDALIRLGGLQDPTVGETLGCENPERTRNKAEYAVSGGEIGLISSDGRTLVPLTDCLLQRAAGAAVLRHLANNPALLGGLTGAVIRENRAGDVMLILTNPTGVLRQEFDMARALFSALPSLASLYVCRLKNRPAHALDGVCRLVRGAAALEETLLGLKFGVSPQSFFQVNPDMAEKLYALALDAAGLSGDGAGEARVLDAYCGTGTITLAAARRARAVGVEIVPSAVRDAIDSARRNGLSERARFIRGDAALEIPALLAAGEKFDAAILDPPRKGCDAALIDALVRSGIPRVAYVSCDPATLARDVKLLAAGGYRLLWARPADMFPWTAHVETVAELTRV